MNLPFCKPSENIANEGKGLRCVTRPQLTQLGVLHLTRLNSNHLTQPGMGEFVK